MVATPHALAGAFASRFARSPRAAVVAGVVSHLALDRVPHTDYRLKNRKALIADLAAASLVSAVLARRYRLAGAGAFGGVLPDLMAMAERRTGVRLTQPLHHANHTSIKPPVLVGVLTQIMTTGLLLNRLRRPPGRARWGHSSSLGTALAPSASNVTYMSRSATLEPQPAPSEPQPASSVEF